MGYHNQRASAHMRSMHRKIKSRQREQDAHQREVEAENILWLNLFKGLQVLATKMESKRAANYFKKGIALLSDN